MARSIASRLTSHVAPHRIDGKVATRFVPWVARRWRGFGTRRTATASAAVSCAWLAIGNDKEISLVRQLHLWIIYPMGDQPEVR
jgi:hypothetical protein